MKKIGKKEYDSEEEAREVYRTFFEKNNSKYYQLDYTITSFQKRIKRNVRGRYPKNYIPKYEDKYKISVKRSDVNEKAIEQEEKRIGCFILISNANSKFSSEDLLTTYKKQSAPETSFKFIKNPTVVGPIFLKTVERLESLAYVVMIAFLVYAILERRVRNNLKKEVEPIIIIGGKNTHKPTGQKILKSLQRMKVVETKSNGKSYRFVPELNYRKEYLLNMERVLRLSGYDMSIYLKPRNL